MKRFFILLCTCMAFAGMGKAQTDGASADAMSREKADTISIQKKGLGYTYTYGSRALDASGMNSLLKADKEAYKMLKGAKVISYVSYPFAYAGGFLLGYEVANLLLRQEVNTTRLCVGGASVLAAFGISSVAEWKLKKAVLKYNQGVLNTAAPTTSGDVAVDFGFTSDGGLGFTLSF